MAIKVLSGILVTRDNREGQVRINLDDNSLLEGPHGLSIDQHRVVGSGRYVSVPCKVVALREVSIHVRPEKLESVIGDGNVRLRINDDHIDARELRITWSATRDSMIEEISYMVVGETRD